MAFATDRDLLVLEPNLFRDIAWAGQRRLSATDGATSGDSLTSASSDFGAAGVGAGHVVMLDAIALEVIERVSATELKVSLLRDSAQDEALPPPALSGAKVLVTSFGPQIQSVHEQLLRALGVEPSDTSAAVTASNITNPAALARLEAIGALHLVFSAAAALANEQDRWWLKAEMYRDRFIAQRRRLAIGIDLDGDGVPEATRRLNTIQFVRG